MYGVDGEWLSLFALPPSPQVDHGVLWFEVYLLVHPPLQGILLGQSKFTWSEINVCLTFPRPIHRLTRTVVVVAVSVTLILIQLDLIKRQYPIMMVQVS